MDLSPFFKSIVESDPAAVVVCDLSHNIIYMNPAAKRRYAKSGGEKLVGRSLMDCHGEKSQKLIAKVVSWFKGSKSHNRVFTFHNQKENKDVYMIALRGENGELIGYYEKHEYRNAETAKLYNMGG